ncbi:type I-U CRISPR-associated helicase/endonuclease Cas3 [Gemmata sp. JC717]|uniref:type I-G CRISPR-associated helicase/endonuclease Cas3g n=1 Tax=Gemmata algarum TaxID=2975278 RepID=UPI0021BB579F|nr:type I-U CRISPR-associated helicase/endonuclease Cas3 [Gemmata algarum]MDY3557238.1 type I-U CRISPR-associated helicase/endonuclease Cas3 [Gemmata algarum]
MNKNEFATAFATLAGTPGPFPWQWELYKRFIAGDIPASCNLPTGLGKTSVIHVWLLALSVNNKLPRRLVYVVNRRTVVDQTTNEVENLRERLPDVPEVEAALWALCSTRPEKPDPKRDRPLAISTLRGQFADNREWSADPSRPAVICGTVDMIGSRLLFSGYGCGFKTRPLHAGFLGQDALIVHDEAHLEPAFQKLLIEIEKEQQRCKDFRPLRVMELTATSRAGGEAFELTKEEKAPPEELPMPTEPVHYVWQRLKAKKGLRFWPTARGEVAKKIGQLARGRKETGQAILVFVRTIDDVKAVQEELAEKKGGVPAEQVQVLTGTLRGLERDRLASEDAVFARFFAKSKAKTREGTVYLICTSAGEVGVDLSADHLVCDLTTLDSMAQRLGRVNRRGEGAAEVDVVCESEPDPKKKDEVVERARWKTKELLERLPPCVWTTERREASPLCLRNLNRTEEERTAAFAPTPTILPVSDILFDAWALTTIRAKLPGRPPVEPYLHGLAEWQPPETHVAWREEVWELRLQFTSNEEREQRERTERKLLAKFAEDLLEDYPLKPHELLRDRTDRVFKHVTAIAARRPDDYAWLVGDEGSVEVFTLQELADKDRKDRLNGRTVLLPPQAGGLLGGFLDGGATSTAGLDVADALRDEEGNPRRLRVWDNESEGRTENMRLIRQIEFPAGEDEDAEGKVWRWFERPQGGDGDWSRANLKPVTWETHTKDVTENATAIVEKLALDDLRDPVEVFRVAAECHDLGKRRNVFQAVLGNRDPNVWLAKSGAKGGRIAETYRHEFGSLIDTANPDLAPGFAHLSEDLKAFVLHVIAAHHGRGRPHFPEPEAFDPERPDADAKTVAREVPRRFAQLQRKYGRWGLAYLESLLRAADYAASAKPSEFVKGDGL